MGVNSASRGVRLLCSLFVVAATIGIARAQDTTPDKGEQIQNGACLSCHDLRPIQTAAYDKAGWTMVLDSMLEKGAEVKAADKPVLVDFLTRNHGPLPDGAGKDILLNTCTVCHDLGRVRIHTVSREEWEETLSAMLNEGAMLSDQDFPVLLNYLARNFRQ
jgi:cytochrome c5